MNEKSAEQMTRRGFLAAVSAAVLVAPVTAMAAPAAARETDILSGIQSVVGQRFMLHLPDGLVAARLEPIKEIRSCANVQQFTCHFQIETKCEQTLTQQVYTLDNKSLGRIELLMLPGNDGPTQSLMATFSRLV